MMGNLGDQAAFQRLKFRIRPSDALSYAWALPLAISLAFPGAWFAVKRGLPQSREGEFHYATKVVLTTPEVEQASKALGGPRVLGCLGCYAILGSGEIQLEFPLVPDAPPRRTLTVYEVDGHYRGLKQWPGRYAVAISANQTDWKDVGFGQGTMSFSLPEDSVPRRFVRIRGIISKQKKGPLIDAVQLDD